jgi:hypothetical protein
MRSCRICNNEYCLIDEDRATAFAVSSSVGDCGILIFQCDWCNISGRRTRVAH